MRFWFFLIVMLGCLLCGSESARAEVRLHPLFSDDMVVQRGVRVPVWGTAAPREKIRVLAGFKAVTTTAGSDGRWLARLEPREAGPPFDLTVAGASNSVTLRNVVAGEVWVCSGQSNMEWPLHAALNAPQEIAAANYPMIRSFTVGKAASNRPLREVTGRWQVCTPQTAGSFSAVGYFFARELHRELKVPVGLIHASWGATHIEAWTSRPALEADPALRVLARHWDRVAPYVEGNAPYPLGPRSWDEYIERLTQWRQDEAQARAEGKAAPPQPRQPLGSASPYHLSVLYNGMIAPLIPYGIKGVVWYQGESNASYAHHYRKLLTALIRDWRRNWKQGDFPFYIVQLANYLPRAAQPGESAWAELREAQLQTLAVPRTGLAVAIDIGDADDIHPTNKQDVGRRLALIALAKDYSRRREYSGPLYQSMKVEGDAIRLKFRHAGGLKTKDGGAPQGFAVAGADRRWVWAEARIEGECVVVWSAAVKQPVAARYAWADNSAANLLNAADLPASPFRTDDWPGITVNNTPPEF